MDGLKVSVIVPLLNEEKYIRCFMDSLLEQAFPRQDMEWILVDGNSTDRTRSIIEEYMKDGSYPIVLLQNEQKKTPYALNMAIQIAKGDYIIRLDAHAKYQRDYIEKCVYYLDSTNADNVGGVAETMANNFMGKAISHMLSTKFGVGGSDFRVSQGNCYVDTVPFGAFRREVFTRVGLFNTKLLRSEDNDMNARIRESGGKIWLAEDIRFQYFCRDTVSGILKMGFQNGNALFHTLKENPKAMSIRHFIPFLFFMSLLIMPILSALSPLFLYAFWAEAVCYGVLDIYFSFAHNTFSTGMIDIWLYPLFHICYGFGSFAGIFGYQAY